MVIRVHEIHLQAGKNRRDNSCQSPPLRAIFARHRRTRHDGERGQVCNMRPQDRGEGIVEVAPRLVSAAEEAFRQDFRAELEVQKAAFLVDEFGPQDVIPFGVDVVGPHGRDAIEEHVDGYLQAALRLGEDVFGRKEGQCFDNKREGEE